MNIGSKVSGTAKRLPCASYHWNLRATNSLQDSKGIVCSPIDGCIPVGGTDAQKMEVRMVCGQEDSECVLLAILSLPLLLADR
jgi:hypothetical protein